MSKEMWLSYIQNSVTQSSKCLFKAKYVCSVIFLLLTDVVSLYESSLPYKLQGTHNCLSLLSFIYFSSFLCLEFASSRKRVRFTEIAMIILFLRFGPAFDSEAAAFCDFFSVILRKDDFKSALQWGKRTKKPPKKPTYIFCPFFTNKGMWVCFPDVPWFCFWFCWVFFWGGGFGVVWFGLVFLQYCIYQTQFCSFDI